MKGKKTDTEFLSAFLSECLTHNITDQEEIVKRAQSQIADIDAEIKKVEGLKVMRSKLMDVVSAFGKKAVARKEEIRILEFFQIKKPELCKLICDSLKDENIEVNSLYQYHPKVYSVADVIYCIKQLLEHKIISKIGDVLMKGPLFDEYMKFVFHEA